MRLRAPLSTSLDGLTDRELIERTRSGDQAAFSTLADRHWDRLVRLCRRHLDGDSHQAEDVAQECLVKLHATIDRDHRPLQPRAWLSVVARHACIDVHRGRRADPVAYLPDRASDDDDPFDADPILGEAWELLTERHRTVLHHRELMGLSYEEIAAAMAISGSAVETLLFRARAALRRNYVRAGGQLLGCGLFGIGIMRAVDGPASADLAAHLTACGNCSSAVDRLGATTELLRSGTHPAPALTLIERARDWLSSLLSGPAATFAGPAIAAAPTLGVAVAAALVAIAPVQAADEPRGEVSSASSQARAADSALQSAPVPVRSDTAPGTASASLTGSATHSRPWNPAGLIPAPWITPHREWTASQSWTSPDGGTVPPGYEGDQQWKTEQPEPREGHDWPEDPACEQSGCQGLISP